MVEYIKLFISSKAALAALLKSIQAVNTMKASRFWAIWLLAFLIASATMIGAIAPQGLVSNDAKVSSESVQP